MPCKITKIKLTREEFVALKEHEPFKTFRQSGKSCNFSLIFGASAKVFSGLALELSWSENQIDDYIKVNKLEDAYENTRSFYKRENAKSCKYITAAAHMRNGFFELYEGLAERIKRNQRIAADVGYIIGPFGNARKTIELMLKGKYDEKEHGGLIRNIQNIAANTDIQQFEAGLMHTATFKVGEWLRANNMKSYIWNTVHDSIDIYIYKPELKAVVDKLTEEMTYQWPQLHGVPLAVDIDVSDLSMGHYYKKGKSVEYFLGEKS